MKARPILLLAALLIAAAAFAEPSDRRELSKSFLFGDNQLSAPVDMHEFSLPDAATLPRHTFSGWLRLQLNEQIGSFKTIHDPWDRAKANGRAAQQLPEFDFAFVQRGYDVVPLKHGVQRREHPYWEIILLPGKAWNEVGDGDWTRASMPFALQERSANCTHYGVLTWVFDATGRVSRAAYQVASETCAYFKFNMWGILEAEYQQQDFGDDAAVVVKRVDSHRRNRLPVRPLTMLASDYPELDPPNLGVADGIDRDDITVLGMVVEGVHYQSDCQTRYGAYPFCASLPLPSYSTAKSIFAGIAAMRLEKLYPGSARTPIASLIEKCNFSRWKDVTIENALDMATGNFLSSESQQDENSIAHDEFVFADKHAQKLDFACNYFKRKAEPGTQFVYHTSDTYLVGSALSKLLARHDSSADLYESALVEPIWHELNLSPLLDTTKRTYDSAAQAYTGYGLTYEADDIVRIATWLNESGGLVDKEALLDTSMLNAALQRAPDDRGLEAGSPNLRYNNGFWAFDAGPSIGCAKPIWVPFMSGFGGITVAMFPNGVIYYYFSDSYVFGWQAARRAANAIGNMCVN